MRDVHQDLARSGHGVGNLGEADGGGYGRIDDESTNRHVFPLGSRLVTAVIIDNLAAQRKEAHLCHAVTPVLQKR
jgi:hypothetical protein